MDRAREPAREPDLIDLTGASWIWLPGETSEAAGEVKAFFRRKVDLPPGIKRARILITADDHFVLFVNGKRTAKSNDVAEPWREPLTVDITQSVAPGSNCFAVKVVNSVAQAGLLAQIVVEQDGAPLTIATAADWRVSTDNAEGWEQPAFDDHAWGAAKELHRYGEGSWGSFLGSMVPPQPSPYLRKSFTAKAAVKRARLYVTALGFYEMHLNGQRVGQDYFTPGCTDYRKRIQYQTYDVTALLHAGENALGAILGDGWYAGNIGWGEKRYHFGSYPLALCAQLEIDYEGGGKDSVFSDATWRGRRGPIQLADMLLGESYDARLELPVWDQPAGDTKDWQPVTLHDLPAAPLVAARDLGVRRIEELAAKHVTEPQPGVFVFDLAQNMVGFARLKVRGAAGTDVTLRFAEVLNPDGTIYTANLRGAKSTDHFILKGGGDEVFEPHFTFHGFRYVEVRGYPGTPPLEAVTGVVLSSATKPAGSFTCSSELLNQLQHNIVWGQRGNFLSIPTDCPQRDERLGWMGDAQIFARTACFNYDLAAFFSKWLNDVDDAQSPDGGFADVSPRVVDDADGAPAWGDAGVIVPWTVYQCYGDARILERHYQAMQKWVEYVHQANPDHLWANRRNNDFGDWVSVGSDTPKDVLASAFYYQSTSLLARAARVVGRKDDAQRYEQLAEQIRAAFVQAFVAADGRIKGDTQTCYALALEFDLLPADQRPAALRYLIEDVAKHQWHLTTGFLGVNRLLPALTHGGFADVALRLALCETFPSWGYCVRHGATTIWERWDGWTEDKGFQDPGMNSFNHYAFGSIGEWLYESIGGIARDPNEPGYKHIVMHAHPGGGITAASAALDSMYGRIASEWQQDGKQFTLKITVPANTTALVYVPASAKEDVTESGKATEQIDDILFQRMEDHCAVFAVNSGHYEFRSPMIPGANQLPPAGFGALFNGKDLGGWKGLVEDPPARARMSKDELAAAQAIADPRAREHWTVFDGMITYDGQDNSLCTARDYGDFELLLEWRILPGGDSGIYLRGSPQVQIWDNPLGSGGLYNNKQNQSNPTKVADRPVGEWNQFRILMVGDRVTVHLNGELVVDQVPLENYWERDKPIYPLGQIELQHHGAPLFFRNVFVREIPRGN
ncbi:MAG: family 78 glycoside hydrolase catalytic domain [Planctomycetota bacterium]